MMAALIDKKTPIQNLNASRNPIIILVQNYVY